MPIPSTTFNFQTPRLSLDRMFEGHTDETSANLLYTTLVDVIRDLAALSRMSNLFPDVLASSTLDIIAKKILVFLKKLRIEQLFFEISFDTIFWESSYSFGNIFLALNELHRQNRFPIDFFFGAYESIITAINTSDLSKDPDKKKTLYRWFSLRYQPIEKREKCETIFSALAQSILTQSSSDSWLFFLALLKKIPPNVLEEVMLPKDTLCHTLLEMFLYIDDPEVVNELFEFLLQTLPNTWWKNFYNIPITFTLHETPSFFHKLLCHQPFISLNNLKILFRTFIRTDVQQFFRAIQLAENHNLLGSGTHFFPVHICQLLTQFLPDLLCMPHISLDILRFLQKYLVADTFYREFSRDDTYVSLVSRLDKMLFLKKTVSVLLLTGGSKTELLRIKKILIHMFNLPDSIPTQSNDISVYLNHLGLFQAHSIVNQHIAKIGPNTACSEIVDIIFSY